MPTERPRLKRSPSGSAASRPATTGTITITITARPPPALAHCPAGLPIGSGIFSRTDLARRRASRIVRLAARPLCDSLPHCAAQIDTRLVNFSMPRCETRNVNDRPPSVQRVAMPRAPCVIHGRDARPPQSQPYATADSTDAPCSSVRRSLPMVRDSMVIEKLTANAESIPYTDASRSISGPRIHVWRIGVNQFDPTPIPISLIICVFYISYYWGLDNYG